MSDESIGLSPIENKIYQAFVKRGADRPIDIDPIARIVYGNGNRPKFWRGCVLVRMRSMILKLKAARGPYVVNRVSPKGGRGNEASYALKKR